MLEGGVNGLSRLTEHLSSSQKRSVSESRNRPFSDTLPQPCAHSPVRMLDLCQNVCQNQRVKTLALS